MKIEFPSEKHLVSSRKDAFARKEYAKVVVEKILNKMQLPNTFGLYGDWGTGKSTILHFMDERIRSTKRLSKKVHVVHFQPWKYEYSESSDLLFALLKEIQRSLDVSDGVWNELGAAVLGVSESFFRNALKTLSKGMVDLDDATKRAEEWQRHVQGDVLPMYEQWSDRFEEVSKLFSQFIQKGLRENNKEKIFVFIDDLDRCLPENTIHLLESIKNFLYQENTLFVLAIDSRVVSEMIEKKYGLHVGYGQEYLEKIVNYQLELPRVSLQQYFEHYFVQHGIEISDAVKRRIGSFIHEHIHAPRRLKRVLGRFVMQKYFVDDFDKILKSDIEFQHAFLATFLFIKYPKHFSGNKEKRSRKIRFLVEASKLSVSNTNNYSNYVLVDNSISPKELKELEAIMRFAFIADNNTNKLVDVDNLIKAFNMMKFQ